MRVTSQDLKLIKAVRKIFDNDFLTQSSHLTPEMLLHMDNFYDISQCFFFFERERERVFFLFHFQCIKQSMFFISPFVFHSKNKVIQVYDEDE